MNFFQSYGYGHSLKSFYSTFVTALFNNRKNQIKEGTAKLYFSHCHHNFKLNWLQRKDEKSQLGKSIQFLNAFFKKISEN